MLSHRKDSSPVEPSVSPSAFDCLALSASAGATMMIGTREQTCRERPDAFSRTMVESTHLWACHRAFHETGNDRENGATGAASGDLAEQRTDFRSTGAARERRQQCLQRLTDDAAANRSRDRVAEHAETVVFERRAGCIAADRAGQELDH